MISIGRDLQFGVRVLGKSPGFTAAILAALALGIGAASAMFSIVDAVLLRPLPFRNPEQLLTIWEQNPSSNAEGTFVAASNVREWRRQSRTLAGVAAIRDTYINLTAGPSGHLEPEELRAHRASADLFPLLGVQPALGRVFREDEDKPGSGRVAVLGYALWKRKFGGDASIIGRTIRLSGQGYTVVGVMADRFAVLNPAVDIWLPLAMDFDDPRAANRRYLQAVARLRPGAGLEQARAEMEMIGARLGAAAPALDKGWRPVLSPLREELSGKHQTALLTLMAAVAFLLLIVCANVANLLMARGTSRRQEIAVRIAMGASRARIVAQLLTESLLLALVGGALGIVLARAAVAVVARYGPANIPQLATATVDARLLLFTLAASAGTGLLFGLVPAAQLSESSVNAVLAEGGRGRTGGRAARLTRDWLVIFEIAIAVVVLIGAGLVMRSFVRLRAADPGFQPAGLLTFRLPLAGGRNAMEDRRAAFFEELETKIAALPGVRSVGAVNALPLNGLSVGTQFAVAGERQPPADQRPSALMRTASADYFRAMGIPLLAGRFFTSADGPGAAPVALVSRTLAERFWPGRNAIGGSIVLDALNGRVAEVVGVVGDVKPVSVEGDNWPTVYTPHAQTPASTMIVVVSGKGDPSSLGTAVAREIRRMDPSQPVADVQTMDKVLDGALARQRFSAGLLSLFAELAFALAALGIYGVVSYDVNRRTNELGLRAALGAQRRDILRLVLGHAARLAGWGIAIGLAAAFALTRLMGNLLYEVGPTDPWTFVSAPLMLGAVALAACYLPSRRAMALDPVAALRHE